MSEGRRVEVERWRERTMERSRGEVEGQVEGQEGPSPSTSSA